VAGRERSVTGFVAGHSAPANNVVPAPGAPGIGPAHTVIAGKECLWVEFHQDALAGSFANLAIKFGEIAGRFSMCWQMDTVGEEGPPMQVCV
jgi:hypothetical protein